MKKEKILQILCSIVLMSMMSFNIALANELSYDSSQLNSESNAISIGNDTSNSATPTRSTENGNKSNAPKITHFVVDGNVDNTKTGIDFYKNISITLIGDNLTDRNFLTKEGLHWSDKTYVELIKGQELGVLNDAQTFGAQNTPTTEVKAYSNNNGDSGRINFVGKTKSNEDLDLIWTVIDSDKDDWAANSGYYNNSRIKGLGFAGEQFIPGASGNSIVVLYNNASNLAINYKIVKHGTMEEIPVVLSFISTDIDAAQGVETNLANITEIIPKESGLVKENNIIYDNVSGVVGLNGSVDLPKGGYLGAGFLSNFDYAFYSPAPARVNNSYHYPVAVRYDIFGSSLQANLYTRLKNHITVDYVDELGNQIKPSENFDGFHDEKYFFESVNIPKYKLIDIKKDESNPNYPKIQFVYRPIYNVSFTFLDEDGNKLSDDKTFLSEKGYILSYEAPIIANFTTPKTFNVEVTNDIEHAFVYKKIVKPVDKKEDTKPQKNSEVTKPIVKEAIKETTQTSLTPINNSQKVYVNNTNTYSINTPINIPTNTQKNKVQIINSTNKEVVLKESSVRDPFLENTGMSKEEKEAFLNYIKAVAKDSRDRNGDDKNKINHDIANAIAYSVYHKDTLQKMTNDFGEKPKELNTELERFFKKIHKESNYLIDFPHLAAPLATAEESVLWKEGIKMIVGLSPLNLVGVSPKDVFFMNNSMTGDLLTNIDAKDAKTDIDAYIFRYHPKFKDLSLDERIEQYYSIDNLNVERQKYYKETLELRGGGNTAKDYAGFINWGSALSLAGLGLVGLTLLKKMKKEWDEFNKGKLAYLNKKIWSPLVEGGKELISNPLGFLGNRILSPISNFTADVLVTGGLVAKVIGTKVFTGLKKIVKPIVKPILAPIRRVVNFVNEIAIKPAVKFVNNTIVKPVKKLANFVNEIAIKPAVKFVHNTIVKPIQKVTNFVYKNAVKPIYNTYIRPVVKVVNNVIVQPVYKNIIKPIVQPIYKKVIKPVGSFINKNIIKPVGNFLNQLFGKR